MGGRLAWGLFLFYLATLGFYLYVRLTSTLDLGLHYQWCAPRMLARPPLHQKVYCDATCMAEHVQCFITMLPDSNSVMLNLARL